MSKNKPKKKVMVIIGHHPYPDIDRNRYLYYKKAILNYCSKFLMDSVVFKLLFNMYMVLLKFGTIINLPGMFRKLTHF